MTRVLYEAEGWGEGELWFEGSRLVWHELPRPRLSEPSLERPRPSRVRPHPGGVNTRRPLRSTIPAKSAHVRDGNAPTSQKLVHALRRYFAGERISFDDVEVDLDGSTPFQLALVRELRRVPYGEVISYSDLARAAGRPKAQRVAGTFCAQNRFPLVLPCHRIVAANAIGGYGSLGVEYKRRLLQLEGCRRAL